MVIQEVKRRLQQRHSTVNYQTADDSIFEPYIDSHALSHLKGLRFHSAYRDLGQSVLKEIFGYERVSNTKINKEQIYFAMAFNSIECGDEINTLAYWELALRQRSRTHRGAMRTASVVPRLKKQFTAIIAAIDESHCDIALLKKLRKTFPSLFLPFIETLEQLKGVHQSEFLIAAIRNRKVLRWIKEVKRFHVVTLFAQEMVNALCVLVESCLKERLHPMGHITFWPLLETYIKNNGKATSVVNILSTLKGQYLCKTTKDFNASFPELLKTIRKCKLSDDEMKAHILYGTWAVRNKSLHQCDLSLSYLKSKSLFEDTIGMLFAAVATSAVA